MKKECECCHRKLRLSEALRFQCKCNKFLCYNHSDISKHECSYNHKKEYKYILEKKLPQVKSSKLEII